MDMLPNEVLYTVLVLLPLPVHDVVGRVFILRGHVPCDPTVIARQRIHVIVPDQG